MALELVCRANLLTKSAKPKISNQTAFRRPGANEELPIEVAETVKEALRLGVPWGEIVKGTSYAVQKRQAGEGYDAVYMEVAPRRLVRLRFLDPPEPTQPTPEPPPEPTQKSDGPLGT